MRLKDLLKNKRGEILRIAARNGARNVRVFGSAARGDDNAQSDVDFLVEMEEGRSLLDLGRLLMELQESLGRRVDLVEVEGLHWFVRDRVLREAIAL